MTYILHKRGSIAPAAPFACAPVKRFDALYWTVDLPGWHMTNASDASLLGGANMAMLGAELIQFGRADALGDNRYRLSHLLRGRGGTESAMAHHDVEEAFVLLQSDPAMIALLPAHIGMTPLNAGMIVEARRAGHDFSVATVIASADRVMRPLAPAHLRLVPKGNGGFVLHWIRRSRAGWVWRDGVDAPLGEADERYRIQIIPSSGAVQWKEVGVPTLDITADEVAHWRSTGANRLTISVCQIGTAALSDESALSFTL